MPGEPISGEFFDPGAAPINVLCMDGGGIRGRCLLAMVEEMEAVLGAPIAEHFDLIAGTSIGGCGSLFLSRYPEWGHATRMARKALQELQSRCFAAKQRNWGRLFSRGFLCADARQGLYARAMWSIAAARHLRPAGLCGFCAQAAARRRPRGPSCSARTTCQRKRPPTRTPGHRESHFGRQSKRRLPRRSSSRELVSRSSAMATTRTMMMSRA